MKKKKEVTPMSLDIWEHSHSRKYGRDTKKYNYDLFKKGV